MPDDDSTWFRDENKALRQQLREARITIERRDDQVLAYSRKIGRIRALIEDVLKVIDSEDGNA